MTVDKSLFEPLESKRSFEEISSKIKALIFSGHLKPGDRLPSENELPRFQWNLLIAYYYDRFLVVSSQQAITPKGPQ